MPRPFLTAEWRTLLMFNYAVDAALLRSFVPAGTELDEWNGQSFVSLVGFLSSKTRLLGVPVPLHETFEEVNLRLYVRRTVNGELRRAVTFIRELVPRAAIAIVARIAYNEPYGALPMRHRFRHPDDSGTPTSIEYNWRLGKSWSGMYAERRGGGAPALAESQEAFITEHYWGYTRQRNGSTIEYKVEHPAWNVSPVESPRVTGEVAALFGPDFARVLAMPPTSALLADGSPVAVYPPTQL